jgi:hypothetical protein
MIPSNAGPVTDNINGAPVPPMYADGVDNDQDDNLNQRRIQMIQFVLVAYVGAFEHIAVPSNQLQTSQ